MRFSERNGFRPIRLELQLDDMDSALRSSLWSSLALTVLKDKDDNQSFKLIVEFCRYSYIHFFKRAVDTAPKYPSKIIEYLRNWFFECPWHDAYDFIEFAIEFCVASGRPSLRTDLELLVSQFLERERSAYRLVSGHITRITAEAEVESVNRAAELSGAFQGAGEHIRTAIQHYSNKNSPDFRNSVKESICAVESAARVLAGNDKATLGDALKVIERKHPIHPALREGLNRLYGYTSDQAGIRHALLEEGSNVDGTDALFMLVVCSAFCNYLSDRSRNSA